jgi:hypothetical protein
MIGQATGGRCAATLAPVDRGPTARPPSHRSDPASDSGRRSVRAPLRSFARWELDQLGWLLQVGRTTVAPGRVLGVRGAGPPPARWGTPLPETGVDSISWRPPSSPLLRCSQPAGGHLIRAGGSLRGISGLPPRVRNGQAGSMTRIGSPGHPAILRLWARPPAALPPPARRARSHRRPLLPTRAPL